MTDGHKNWNRSWDTKRYKNWMQNKLMGGHNIWSRDWQDNWVRNMLKSHSIESVAQAVGVRPEKGVGKSRLESIRHCAEPWCQQRHPATRGYRCHWDAEAGVPYSTAGKCVVWDEGRRLLVSKDTEVKLMTLNLDKQR